MGAKTRGQLTVMLTILVAYDGGGGERRREL